MSKYNKYVGMCIFLQICIAQFSIIKHVMLLIFHIRFSQAFSQESDTFKIISFHYSTDLCLKRGKPMLTNQHNQIRRTFLQLTHIKQCTFIKCVLIYTLFLGYLQSPSYTTFWITLPACLHWHGILKPDCNYVIVGEEVHLPIARVTVMNGICIHRNIFH